MKWTDNLLLEGDWEQLKKRGQWQLAMYALHLGTGNSIYCKQIKTSTIEQYVFAAASFISLFTGVDYRKDNPQDRKMGHILGPVYRDLRKYEAIPDRREPYDFEMHKLAQSLSKDHHFDSLIPALVDGFEEGLCAGYRLTEWAQPAGNWSPKKPILNHLVKEEHRTRALVPNDYRAMTYGKVRVVGLDIVFCPLESIYKLWVRFRAQKNGQHNEEKLFVRNPNKAGVCFVAAVYRKLVRFQRLQRVDPSLDPWVTPLALYKDARTSAIRLITATDIEEFMRKLATQVYHLHPVRDADDIRKWSSHSLRVGACVVLHAMGFSTLDIQWILRWRSMAFVAYLRNVAMLATRHHRALDKAAGMPHLI